MSKRVSGKAKFFALSFLALGIMGIFCFKNREAYAAVGSCADATLSFSQANYELNDTIRLNGHNASGTWTLCIYRPDGQRAVSTMLSGNNTTSTSASTEGVWTGVITPGAVCPMNLSGANNCRVTTRVGPASGGTGGTGSGGGGEENPVDFSNPIETDDFTELVQNVLRWILSIAGGIALFMLIYGGVTYMTSAGDPQKAEQGKKIVIWTVAGLIVILLSYSIIVLVESIFA